MLKKKKKNKKKATYISERHAEQPTHDVIDNDLFPWCFTDTALHDCMYMYSFFEIYARKRSKVRESAILFDYIHT